MAEMVAAAGIVSIHAHMIRPARTEDGKLAQKQQQRAFVFALKQSSIQFEKQNIIELTNIEAAGKRHSWSV